jgi:hypothetical protein
VTFDPQTKPFLGVIRYFNRDGSRRSGPIPVFREEEVASLW